VRCYERGNGSRRCAARAALMAIGQELADEAQAFQVNFVPSRAHKELLNRLRTKGVTEFVIHNEHPPTIGVLIDMV